MVFLLILTFIAEGLANIVGRKYHNSSIVYNFFNPFELLCFSLYFNYSVDVFRKRNIGWYIAGLGIVIGIINVTARSIFLFNSYYLLFEGFTVNAMSLFALFRLFIKNDALQFRKYPHFWFPVTFLMFWSITFLNWGLYDYLILTLKRDKLYIDLVITFINIFTYLAMGLILFLFPKMHLKHAD